MMRRNITDRCTLSPVSVVRLSSIVLDYPFDDSPTSLQRRQAEPVPHLAAAAFRGAPRNRRLTGHGCPLKKLGLVSLTIKRASLLDKFPIAERGTNALEKQSHWSVFERKPKTHTRRKLSGIILA
jgi:hypothetical protein